MSDNGAGRARGHRGQRPTAALAGQERLAEPVARTGMFGGSTAGDTSGYGGLLVRCRPRSASPRPYGSYFDELADELARVLEADGPGFGDAIERVVCRPRRADLPRAAGPLAGGRGQAARRARRWPSSCAPGVSGVHYPADTGRELHAVYHLVSITHNRRLRLEVARAGRRPAHPLADRRLPDRDWHERETWDFFGIIFDGHPALTRIEMPDDWKGHPQRKDYPLGGIPVEYRGATVPPPDERRAYA